jgi:hypothetical protein
MPEAIFTSFGGEEDEKLAPGVRCSEGYFA